MISKKKGLVDQDNEIIVKNINHCAYIFKSNPGMSILFFSQYMQCEVGSK